MNTEPRFDGAMMVVGTAAGFVAWIVGYALTYAIVSPEVRESALNRFIEAFEGEPATYEMTGWVFYNAHFVDTVFSNLPLIGSASTSFVGGDDGFGVLLYVIPIGLLVAAGLALARYRGAANPSTGAISGAMVVPGYLLLSVVGVFLFEVSIAGASGAPDLLPAIIIAGGAYPVVFGGVGGAIGGILEHRAGHE